MGKLLPVIAALLVGVGLIPLAVVTRPAEWKTPFEGTVEGKVEAVLDVGAGRLGWRTIGGWGLRSYTADYEAAVERHVLDRDYGIKVKHTSAGHGCTPPGHEGYLRARSEAYNAIMKPRIEAKHGYNVFADAEARAQHEIQTKPPFPFEPKL